jgi:hypothetical protein
MASNGEANDADAIPQSRKNARMVLELAEGKRCRIESPDPGTSRPCQ